MEPLSQFKNSRKTVAASSAPFALLTRRTLLASLTGGIAIVCKGQSPAIVTSRNRIETPHCMLASEQTEGPYYVDQRILRADITENRPGIPLRLEMTILDGRRCTPVPNAAVSIWHCDAAGVYSGFTSQGPDGPPGPPPFFGDRPFPPVPPPHHRPSDNTRFFRGVQITGLQGEVTFHTIYPGWYMGRDIHIHLKVMTGGHVCHTGQLFLPEDLSDAVSHLAPYKTHRMDRTRQEDDDVFTSQHGADFILTPVQLNARNMAEGFTARVVMGVDPDAQPEPVGFGGPPPRG